MTAFKGLNICRIHKVLYIPLFPRVIFQKLEFRKRQAISFQDQIKIGKITGYTQVFCMPLASQEKTKTERQNTTKKKERENEKWLSVQGNTSLYILRATEKKKKTRTWAFIAALFTIARTWKQPKRPSTDERIKKMWYRGFPGGAVVENPPANAGDTGSGPGPGRSYMPRSN